MNKTFSPKIPLVYGIILSDVKSLTQTSPHFVKMSQNTQTVTAACTDMY